MQEVVACAHRHPPHGRGTVGMVQVHPNSRNVIPGRVKFSIDLRNATDALVDQMADEVKAFAAQVGRERRGREDQLVSSYPAQLSSRLRGRRGPRRRQAGLQQHAGCLRRRARRRLHGQAGPQPA
jgi:acetylornithine deacetylase/succinyl-diaminopimelate desuccinylase-like protein